MKVLSTLSMTLLVACLTACGGASSSTSSSSTGFLQLSATDAPLDPALVESAEVVVDRGRIHRSGDDDVDGDSGGWIEIFDGPPRTLPLSDLRNGITALISNAELATGTYGQVRLHLTGGELVLTNGDVFTTADGSLHMPSATNSSGLKVKFTNDLVIETDVTKNVVLDFDLSRTFKPVPGNDPLNANHFKLHPVIRAAVLEGSGDLNVLVREDDGAGTLVAVENATVYVLAPGELDVEEALASSITDATGTAIVVGLDPGTYDVRAETATSAVQMNSVVITAGSASAIDLILP